MLFLLIGKNVFVDIVMKGFLPVLEEKSCGDGHICAGLEHLGYLVTDLNKQEFGIFVADY